MKRHAATHLVITILVVFDKLVGVVHGFVLVIDLDAVLKIAYASLDEKTTVGVGLERKQFSDLDLEVESSLKDRQGGEKASSSDDLTRGGGDALAENADAVALQLVAEDEIAIGREYGVVDGLIDEAPANGVGEAKAVFRVHAGELRAVGDLKHGGGNHLIGDVPGGGLPESYGNHKHGEE